MLKERVLMVGSAEQSGGGVASAIRIMKRMPFWKERQCGWLGTQIQAGYAVKAWYALRSYAAALFLIWRYGIIHFHTVPDRICLVIQLPVFLLAKLARKKVIMHIHMGNQLEYHTRNTLFIWCLRHADRVVLLARKWQKTFVRLYPNVSTPTAVIYNACENNVEVDWEEKKKSIIMAAHLDENKRPALLLKAWERIHKDFPEWHVTIMGNGDVAHYQQKAKDLGLNDTVTFTGYITGTKKESIWREASIYVMCSRHEGFPMVVLEAWAHGVAVVTTPVGGLPDVMEEERNCLSIPFDDDTALAHQLSRLTGDKKLRRRIAEYAKDNTLGQFSIERINADIEAIYQKM